MAELLGEVGRLLGCRGDLPVLVDYVMDEFGANSDLRCEYLLLLSHILAGGGHKGCGHTETPPMQVSHDELYVIVESVISRLVKPDMWLRSSGGQTLTSDLPDLQAFLVIHVIFTSVHVLEVNFDPLLQYHLHYLMEKLGNENVGVANAAMSTLEAICQQCCYK